MHDPVMIYVELAQYAEDQKRLRWLDALEAAGVDSWEGIDEARQIFYDTEPEDDDDLE